MKRMNKVVRFDWKSANINRKKVITSTGDICEVSQSDYMILSVGDLFIGTPDNLLKFKNRYGRYIKKDTNKYISDAVLIKENIEDRFLTESEMCEYEEMIFTGGYSSINKELSKHFILKFSNINKTYSKDNIEVRISILNSGKLVIAPNTSNLYDDLSLEERGRLTSYIINKTKSYIYQSTKTNVAILVGNKGSIHYLLKNKNISISNGNIII